MNNLFWGEFLGTAMLVLLGDGVVANVCLAENKGYQSGWIVITAGWGFAVLCGVFVATSIGAPGYINPGVALAFTIKSGDYGDLATFWAAEFSGAFVGAVLVWLAYLPHWRVTTEPAAKLACFCTAPAIRSPASNLLTEIIATWVLVFVSAAIGAKLFGVPNYFSPLLAALLVWAIGISLGGPTGYAINPARDLGPRIAHAILPIAGKGGSDWGYAWVPVLGPIIGAVLGILLAQLISIH